MKKLIPLLVLLIITCKFSWAQQDAQFSQYMFNGIYINPAYAGYKETLNMHGFYRNQWTGIVGSPKSMSLAVDAIANDGNVGLAFQVSSDKLGAQSNLAAFANYAYRLKLNSDGSSRLSLGIGAGVMQLGIDGALLSTNTPEINAPSDFQSTIVPDARAGVYFANDKFYAGFSVDNLISQYVNIDRYAFIAQPKPHYYLNAGMLLPLSKSIQVKPSFLIKEDASGPTSLDLTAFLILADKIWIGGAYRTGIKIFDKSYLQKDLSNRNSAVAALEVFATNQLRIGYAYDFSIGPLKGYSNGSHEISIGYYILKRTIRMKTPRLF